MAGGVLLDRIPFHLMQLPILITKKALQS